MLGRVIEHDDVGRQRPRVRQRLVGVSHLVQAELEVDHVAQERDLCELGTDDVHGARHAP